MKRIDRRQFLKRSSAAAMLAATPGMTFAQMLGGDAPIGPPFDDYRALVCVFLFGGNDSFNVLIPRSNAEYDVYAASRQNLAIAQDDLLAINPQLGDGAQYGLHPSMGALRDLFEAQSAALVTNVGPLIVPTTKDQVYNKSVALPPQLFSHNDQQDQWQSLRGNVTSKTGWAGRIADLLRLRVADQQMATNASLTGTNLMQAADQTVAYVMGPDGPQQFAGFSNDPADILYQQKLTFQRIVDANYGSIYERAFAEVQKRAIDAADKVSAAIESAPAFTTVFPTTPLGTQLQTVAKLIAVRDDLQMRRQIFFVGTGGFDSHDNQAKDQPGLLGNLSECLSAFHAANLETGVADNVTTFTESDFGRTLTSNGDGTDHGWGGNQIVVGGAVRGRNLYGQYPLLEIGGPEDVAGGRMIPSTSADQYAATLAKWFGIDDANLGVVAPNIANFSQHDLGFMS